VRDGVARGGNDKCRLRGRNGEQGPNRRWAVAAASGRHRMTFFGLPFRVQYLDRVRWRKLVPRVSNRLLRAFASSAIHLVKVVCTLELKWTAKAMPL
jgi:hypothetical protein